MQDAWQRLQGIRQSLGPRIDSLNAQQEAAFENMKRSFEAASSAHERRDGASAQSFASEGHRYKAEVQGYVAECRLVDGIKSGRLPHDAAKAAFERTTAEFRAAKHQHDRVKSEHEQAQEEFKKRKAAADDAKQAFHKRLEWLKAQGKQRKEDKRSIAERVGVPYQYRDNV